MRHGQVRGHDEKRINGYDDIDLTQEGTNQSHRLGQWLKGEGIVAVYASDLKRSWEGAQIIGRYLSIDPEPPLPEFREKGFGVFEGLTLQEIKERYPAELEQLLENWIGYCPPGAEPVKELEQRVIRALQSLLKKHEGEKIALVGHGGVNRIILLHSMGLGLEHFFSFEQDYGCLNILDFHARGARICLLNGKSPA